MDGRCGAGKDFKYSFIWSALWLSFWTESLEFNKIFCKLPAPVNKSPFPEKYGSYHLYICPSEDQARPELNVSFGDKRENVDIITLGINYNSNMGTLGKTLALSPTKHRQPHWLCVPQGLQAGAGEPAGLQNPSRCFMFCGKYSYEKINIFFKNKLWSFKIKTCHCFSMWKWLSKLADHFKEAWWEVISHARVPGDHQPVERALYVHLSRSSQPVPDSSCFPPVCSHVHCLSLQPHSSSFSSALLPCFTPVFPSVYFLSFLLPLYLMWLSFLPISL